MVCAAFKCLSWLLYQCLLYNFSYRHVLFVNTSMQIQIHFSQTYISLVYQNTTEIVQQKNTVGCVWMIGCNVFIGVSQTCRNLGQ